MMEIFRLPMYICHSLLYTYIRNEFDEHSFSRRIFSAYEFGVIWNWKQPPDNLIFKSNSTIHKIYNITFTYVCELAQTPSAVLIIKFKLYTSDSETQNRRGFCFIYIYFSYEFLFFLAIFGRKDQIIRHNSLLSPLSIFNSDSPEAIEQM